MLYYLVSDKTNIMFFFYHIIYRYHLLLLAGPPNYIQCLYKPDISKFWLENQR